MAEDHDKFWTTIEAQRTAMLTTISGQQLDSRPMATYADRGEGRIHLITGLDDKTRDIAAHAPVNLAYMDTSDRTYVSVSGTAQVSQDREKLRALWNPFAQAWLPEGPDGANVALITVNPREATIWDSDSSRIVVTAKALAAATLGTTPDAGKVEHVSL